MSDDVIVQSMRSNSDEELLAITSGTAMGYTDQARAIAERVLRERRVQLPRDLKELRKRAAAAEVEAYRRVYEQEGVRDRATGRVLGIRLIILGVGAFILPILGFQFRVLIPFGSAIRIAAVVLAIAGYVIVLRTSENTSHMPHDDR